MIHEPTEQQQLFRIFALYSILRALQQITLVQMKPACGAGGECNRSQVITWLCAITSCAKKKTRDRANGNNLLSELRID